MTAEFGGYPYDLMNATLSPGVRKLPSPLDVQILNTVRGSAATVNADRLEANNTPAAVTFLGSVHDVTQAGLSAGFGDEDWFRVQASEGGYLGVELTGFQNLELHLYDDAGHLLRSSNSAGDRRIDFPADVGDQFLIRVFARGLNRSDYGLRVSSGPLRKDTAPPNQPETPPHAQPLTPEAGAKGGSGSTPTFLFSGFADNGVTLTSTWLSASLDPAGERGWTLRGNAVVNTGVLSLAEDDSVLSGATYTFTAPGSNARLRFTNDALNLQPNSTGSPPDAFEVALLNSSKSTLVSASAGQSAG